MGRLKAVCPNNERHQRFITVAHVAEDWEVDPAGNWVCTVGCTETVARPDPGNTWTCKACGAEAVFKEGA